jgi:hypothetical protein
MIKKFNIISKTKSIGYSNREVMRSELLLKEVEEKFNALLKSNQSNIKEVAFQYLDLIVKKYGIAC